MAVALAALMALLGPAAHAGEQKLTASDGAAGDFFGSSVAISGNTLVVGSRFDDIGAYVFARNGGIWTQQQKLTASDGAPLDRFGFAVAISGDTLIVGSPSDDIGASANQGSAYVFVYSGGAWTEQQKLTASDGASNDSFGLSVAVSGDTLVVTAVGDDNSRGSAYVFVRSGGVWTEQQKLTASDGLALDGFGFSAAISGNAIVVGATSDDGGRGSAYVFVRNSSGIWTQQQRLIAGDRAPGDVFGQSVAISGHTIVVASPFDDVDGKVNQGSAYVFGRGSNGIWTEQRKLTASDGAAGDQFGNSVAIRGGVILVGSPGDDVGANGAQGSTYVFVRRGGSWTERRKLTASDGAANDFFGINVAISGQTFLIGAAGDEGNRGSAYVVSVSAEDLLAAVAAELEDLLADDPDRKLTQQLEDALGEVEAALAELAQTPPDPKKAIGEIKNAIDALEAAVKDGLPAAVANDLMDRLAGAGRGLAEVAIEEAIARVGNPGKISQAQQAVADGDAHRAAGAFKDAIGKYKDGVSNAEAA